SHRTTAKKISRLTTTCQVPEEKKSWTPPKVLEITARFFRSSIQQETQVRRSPRGRRSRKRRRSACRQRSPSYALILGQIGQEVKGSGDEHRATGRPGTAKGFGRVIDGLDLGEVAPGALGQIGCGEGSRAARTGRDEAVAEGGEPCQHPFDVLVGEDRGDQCVAGAREACEDVADAGEVVGAVPDLERVVGDAV